MLLSIFFSSWQIFRPSGRSPYCSKQILDSIEVSSRGQA